jgi:hypothetical protein
MISLPDPSTLGDTPPTPGGHPPYPPPPTPLPPLHPPCTPPPENDEILKKVAHSEKMAKISKNGQIVKKVTFWGVPRKRRFWLLSKRAHADPVRKAHTCHLSNISNSGVD